MGEGYKNLFLQGKPLEVQELTKQGWKSLEGVTLYWGSVTRSTSSKEIRDIVAEHVDDPSLVSRITLSDGSTRTYYAPGIHMLIGEHLKQQSKYARSLERIEELMTGSNRYTQQEDAA